MREVAVQEAGDREHPEEVEADGGPDGDRASTDPDDGETGQLKDTEGNGAGPIDLLRGVLQGFDAFRDVVRIKPADQGTEESVLGALGRGGGTSDSQLDGVGAFRNCFDDFGSPPRIAWLVDGNRPPRRSFDNLNMHDAYSGQDWRAWFAEHGARLRLIARQSRLPVIALGGMTPERARTLDWPRWAAIDGLS